MAERTGWRRAFEPWLSVGAVPSETETQRGGRRVLLVAIYIGTLLSVPTAFADLDAGYTRVAAMTVVTTIVTVALGLAVWRQPRRLFLCVQLLAAVVYVSLVLEATWFGGLVASGALGDLRTRARARRDGRVRIPGRRVVVRRVRGPGRVRAGGA